MRRLTRIFRRRVSPGSERGQVLVIFAGIFVLVMLVGSAAVDYGMWLSERRGLARSADLAALAAAQDLPADPASSAEITSRAACDNEACEAAFDWAERNGYGADDGASVIVSFWCGNTIGPVIPGICDNENTGSLSPCPSTAGERGCDAIKVVVKKNAFSLFSVFYGGVDIEVGYTSWANVSFKVTPTDTVLVPDATSSMAGQPIQDAATGARNFKDILLTAGNTISQVGYVPFKGCYDPPRNGLASNRCVRAIQLGLNSGRCNSAENSSSLMMCLGSYDDPPQHSTRMGTKITNTLPLPNALSTGTNICQALEYGRIVLDDSPRASDDEDRKRFLVILSDGDNFWNRDAYVAGSSPNSNCLVSTTGCPSDSRSGANLNADGTPNNCAPTGQDPPTNPTGSDPTGCNHPLSSTKRERQLDLRALARADVLKTDADDPDNIEIYVVALDVCGRRNQPYPNTDPQPTQYATTSYCNGIGNANNDSTADRRLLKCIASSSPGTNDHYYEVRSSGELPAIFQAIAYEIAGRGLAVAPAPP